jgi:hypothetical protein
VLIGSVALTQNQKKNKPVERRPTVVIDSMQKEEDSVDIVGTPTGDDPWKEVAKLVDAYYLKAGIEYKGVIKVIDDNGDKEKVIEEQPFEYTILNNDYYYRLAHMEVVNRKNMLMAIDNENKTISIARSVAMQKSSRVFDIRAFKKVMQKGNAHALVTRLGDEKVLTIDNIGDADIQGYRIYYSPQTYRIHKMLIGMARLTPLEDEIEDQSENNKPVKNDNEAEISCYYYYLEVLFTQVQPLALEGKSFNPEQKFLQIQQGSITLTPAFKEYQLLNTIEP